MHFEINFMIKLRFVQLDVWELKNNVGNTIFFFRLKVIFFGRKFSKFENESTNFFKLISATPINSTILPLTLSKIIIALNYHT